jgi:hypothetical protein
VRIEGGLVLVVLNFLVVLPSCWPVYFVGVW